MWIGDHQIFCFYGMLTTNFLPADPTASDSATHTHTNTTFTISAADRYYLHKELSAIVALPIPDMSSDLRDPVVVAIHRLDLTRAGEPCDVPRGEGTRPIVVSSTINLRRAVEISLGSRAIKISLRTAVDLRKGISSRQFASLEDLTF